jgi:hypothetical protein
VYFEISLRFSVRTYLFDFVLGDLALGGQAIKILGGHIKKPFSRRNLFTEKQEEFDPNQIFTSPSPRYSNHAAYAKPLFVHHPEKPGCQLAMHFMFQCRQRPGSYGILMYYNILY